MTWRAFIIGLIGVIALNLYTPYNDFTLGNTFMTGNHFPVGVVFFLIFLTLVVNVLIKLVRRSWTLRQAELMLVWCMMLVSANIPASGLMRYWFPTAASAPYLAARPDLFWEDDVLKQAPDGILLSKNPKSVAAKRFYDGTPEGEVIRVPWGKWAKVLVNWGIFTWLYFLATFYICGILRKHWVENERLMFPLARVPLEFTEGAQGRHLLPALVRNRAFIVGAVVTIVFGLMRLSPLFFGEEEGWRVRIPVREVLQDTPWWRMYVEDGWVFPIGIAFAYLVPSDISLSIWFFYIFTCAEIQIAYVIGRPLEGGPWGPFLRWQQAGAFVALTLGLLWSARRHLKAVFLKAIGRGAGIDDSEEPISYRTAFWGLVVSVVGMIAWNMWFGMSLWAALSMLALCFTLVVVHARLITQGGLFFTQQSWSVPDMLHDMTGGRIFGGAAAVVAQAQYGILYHDAREILSPHVMNAMRISSVFQKRRRLFMPVMLVALAVGMVAAGYSTMRWVFYDVGALNIKQTYSVIWYPQSLYERVHQMIAQPAQSARPYFGALGTGAGLMTMLMVLRRSFYWWPIHSLGFVVAESWCIKQLWFSFFLGWLTKVTILKFGGGSLLRSARTFFLAVIITEIAVIGISTIVSAITGTPTGYVFLSL